MTPLVIALLSTQAITLLLGFFVYLNNSKRLVNRQFLILSVHLTTWAFCVLRIIESTDSEHAGLWIRAAFFVTAFFPASFTILLSAIRFGELHWFRLYTKHAPFLSLNLVAALLTLTPFFMKGVLMPATSPEVLVSEPEASYGPGYYIYVAYFIATCIVAGKNFYSVYRGSKGIERFELQFILYGFCATFIVGAISALVLPILLGTNQTSQFGPLGIILLDAIVAYGITTRKILGIATILQRIAAYALLTSYLVLIYFVTWFIVIHTLTYATAKYPSLPHLFAAVTVAFSMVPVQGRFQVVANKLISSNTMDVPKTMRQASTIFQSVTTRDALLGQFTALLEEALGTSGIIILLRENNRFVQSYPKNEGTPLKTVASGDATCVLIEKSREAVSRDTLKRYRQTNLSLSAIQQLQDIGSSVAVGIFSKTELNGIVLLESRIDGRIYDRTEQDALQLLSDQFAVALENAQLYTEMQDSKIRNEIMLDQLVSGVIVANPERKITLFNHEAQRITGIPDTDAIGMDIEALPKPIFQALDNTLKKQSSLRNIDAKLYAPKEQEEGASIRMGSAFLFGHDDKPMGALLVFTDITELKGLEEQVRRSDQLSSVGTLAAGMAHEIKNPLVTIKTFTQLLPQRYADEDFRNDFASLVAHEVSRIDGIVNELLSFSKPTQPHLVPMDLRETVEQTLKLIHEQLSVNQIALNTKLKATKNTIMGDAKVLSQALVNLNLNAIEAIGENGTITVGTINCIYRFANGDSPEKATTRKCIRLQITDSGKGIEQENLQKIFDPFFTSKSEGTGMGLSVAHGIINEHHGVIEVESEPGLGTTFYVYIPVLEEGAKT